MDRYVCLKKSDVIIPPEGDDVSSSSDEDDYEDGDDSDEDEESEEMLSGEEEVSEIKGVEEVVAEPVGDMHRKRCMPSSPLTKSKLKVSLRDQATAFMGVSKDTKRSEDDIISTPLPGETLAVFYARSRKFYFGNMRLGSRG